jgi:hypothetical protein
LCFKLDSDKPDTLLLGAFISILEIGFFSSITEVVGVVVFVELGV